MLEYINKNILEFRGVKHFWRKNKTKEKHFLVFIKKKQTKKLHNPLPNMPVRKLWKKRKSFAIQHRDMVKDYI